MPPKTAATTKSKGVSLSTQSTSKGKDSTNLKPGSQASSNTTTTNTNIPTKPSNAAPDDSYLQIDPNLMKRTGLNSTQLQELIEIFSLVDVDHGGTIDTDELGVLMNTVGLHVSQMELEAMVKELDSENTGEIDFESFVGAMTKPLETDITPDDLAKAFKILKMNDQKNGGVVPTEHEGTLTRSTLIDILTSYGDLEKRLTESEAVELINSVAPHGSHTVFDYIQFIRMYFPNATPLPQTPSVSPPDI
ncbi:hypothetical protein HK100_002144 [Physocladia obscura]|uniref:EF-hand domain-containing protein n=1 Tax=Physocladia obscura TaxID=109957 RepID=A0AAD5SVS6_9FUNG|nr:hypothetical protein HK100_002144 [Physocladia obscura]